MFLSLNRIGCKCSVRAVPEISENLLQELVSENKDFYIFTDLGGGWASKMKTVLGERWLTIDHHQLPQEEILTDDSNQIFNAWKYGLDGGIDISSGGMAYELAIALNSKNRDLSAIAVVSAIADRQDQGDKRSLTGVNAEILATAESLRIASRDLDVMVTGRETRPIHEALALTSTPYIHNLTWNSEKCHAMLTAAGLRLKHDGRWRVFSELTQEEKGIVLDAVAKYIAVEGSFTANVIDEMIGYVYTIEGEDKRSQLRDAREFSTMLNAAGRTGNSGVGISLCTGDRDNALFEAEKIVQMYRNSLKSYINAIVSDESRTVEEQACVFITGEGIIPEKMLGAVSSLLGSSQSFSSKLLFVRTLSDDGKSYKFSCRRGSTSRSKINLGLLMRECATKVCGTGGGHSGAAGCRVPSDTVPEFLLLISTNAREEQFVSRF